MKLKKRISSKRSTRSSKNDNKQEALESVLQEPTQDPDNEQSRDQKEWHWMDTLTNWDFTAFDLAPDADREDYSSEGSEEEPSVSTPSEQEKKQGKMKTQFRPMIAALKQKLRRKPKPLLNLEEDNEDTKGLRALAKPDSDESKSTPRQPLLTYEQWESFMDTVAFPEKSMPYLALKEYLSNREEYDTSNDAGANDSATNSDSSGSDAENFLRHVFGDEKLSWGEYLSTQSVMEESVQEMKESNITWEEFLDTVAFPEKILARKYEDVLAFIARNRVGTNNYRSVEVQSNTTKISKKKDRYDLEDEEQIEFSDHVSLFSMLKEDPGEDLGISLTLVDAQNGLFVSSVVCGSKAAVSGLKPGYQILSINRESYPKHPEEAMDLIRNTRGEVQIFAQPGVPPSLVAIQNNLTSLTDFYDANIALVFNDDDSAGDSDSDNSVEEDTEGLCEDEGSKQKGQPKAENTVGFFSSFLRNPKPNTEQTFSITKGNKSEVVGVAFVQTDNCPGIFVSQVIQTSKFYKSGLKKGMKIVSINDQPCPKDIHGVIDRIQSISGGELKFTVATEPYARKRQIGDDSFVSASIYKSEGDSTGLTLRKDRQRGGIFVNDIDPYSEFVTTELRSGLRIVSINGKKCPKTVLDCMSLMNSMGGKLDIIAKKVAEERLRLD